MSNLNNAAIVQQYFNPSEFTCKGVPCLDRMNPAFLAKLVALRERCKFPFRLNSTWRSLSQNKDVGGANNSMHLYGRAVDIAVQSSQDRATLIREALDMGLSVGVMENAIHVDDRYGDQVVFHYYAKYIRR